MRPWASCCLSILCLPYYLCPQVGREKSTLLGNLERDGPSGFCIRKAKLRRLDLEGLSLRALPCPPSEGGDKPALPSSGPVSREPVSRAWQAEQALARPAPVLLAQVSPLSGFLISLLPQALPALWPSPHSPGTGSQRGGVLERGPRRGDRGQGGCLGSSRRGRALRSHPQFRRRMGFGSAFSFPACPRGWL